MNFSKNFEKNLKVGRTMSCKKEKEALSYREKMPVKEILVYKNGSVDAVCPRCKTPLDREFMAFCDCCGQRLGWQGFSYKTATLYIQ